MKLTKDSMKRHTAPFKPKAVILQVDEMSEVMSSSNFRMVSNIQNNIASILRLGRAAACHCVLATQRPSSNVINADMKNNIQLSVLLGEFDSGASTLLFDKDVSAMSKPEIKGRGFIKTGKDIMEFQSFWTEKKRDFIPNGETVEGHVNRMKRQSDGKTDKKRGPGKRGKNDVKSVKKAQLRHETNQVPHDEHGIDGVGLDTDTLELDPVTDEYVVENPVQLEPPVTQDEQDLPKSQDELDRIAMMETMKEIRRLAGVDLEAPDPELRHAPVAEHGMGKVESVEVERLEEPEVVRPESEGHPRMNLNLKKSQGKVLKLHGKAKAKGEPFDILK